MYNLLENRNKSSDDFVRFLSYMVEQRNHLNTMSECQKDDFIFHYGKIASYFEEYISKYEYEILKSLATIEIASRKIGEVVKER